MFTASCVVLSNCQIVILSSCFFCKKSCTPEGVQRKVRLFGLFQFSAEDVVLNAVFDDDQLTVTDDLIGFRGRVTGYGIQPCGQTFDELRPVNAVLGAVGGAREAFRIDDTVHHDLQYVVAVSVGYLAEVDMEDRFGDRLYRHFGHIYCDAVPRETQVFVGEADYCYRFGEGHIECGHEAVAG